MELFSDAAACVTKDPVRDSDIGGADFNPNKSGSTGSLWIADQPGGLHSEFQGSQLHSETPFQKIKKYKTK